MNARRRFERAFLLLLLVGTFSAPRTTAQEPAGVPPSGTYRGTVVVRPIVEPGEPSYQYRMLGPTGPQTEYFLEIPSALVLGVPDGGSAQYRIEVRRAGQADSVVREYRVLGAPPEAPRIEPAPGLYAQPIEVRVISATETQSSIAVGALPLGRLEFNPFDEPIQISGEAGRVVDYRVVAFASDVTGIPGPTAETVYRIDRRNEREPPAQPILSPVAGRFGNPQMLILDTTGLTDLAFSLNGEPAQPYAGPVLIEREGQHVLEVTARRALDGSVARYSVGWAQAASRTFDVDQTGRRMELLPDPQPGATWRYTVTDRTPQQNDPLLLQPLRFGPTPGVDRTVVVRLRRFDREEPELRFIMSVRGAIPPPVTATVRDGMVYLYSVTDALIEYSRRSDGPWEPYRGPISLVGVDPPVVARARFPRGEWGVTGLASLPRYHDVPAPQATLDVRGNELHLRAAEVERHELLIELTGAVQASARSAAGQSTIRVPEGVQGTVQARIAYRNLDSGVVGAWIEMPGVAVDTAAPDSPRIGIENARVRIDGAGELWYRIVGTEGFIRYQGPFVLTAPESVRSTIAVESYALRNGRRSAITRTTTVIDRREIQVPPLSTVPALSNAESISIEIFRPSEDIEVFYEIRTDGSQAPLPTERSAAAESRILIQAPNGRVTSFNVALRARFVGTTRWSAVRRLQFTVDRDPPRAPRPESPRSGTFPEAVILRFVLPGAGEALWFRTAENEDFRLYAQPVVLDVPVGSVQDFRIDAYVEDLAGNRTRLDEPIGITVDRSAPSAPDILIGGSEADGRVLSTEALVTLSHPEGEAVRLFVAEGFEPLVDAQFLPWDGTPLLLAAEGAAAQRRQIVAYAVDQAGNRGPSRSAVVQIDTRIPEAPAEPSVMADAAGGALWWEAVSEHDLFYAFEGGVGIANLPPNRFVRYEEPVRFNFEGSTGGRLIYFTRNAAGTRSPVRSMRLLPRIPLEAPRLEGASNGGVYADARTIRPAASESDGVVVRYEVALNGQSPAEVHALSPHMPESLRYEAEFGQELRVALRARAFVAGGAVSEATELHFAIDRVPPGPPRFSGIEDHAVYPDSVTFTVVPDDNRDTIYLRLWRGGESVPQFTEYDGRPVHAEARSGALTAYTIEAYTADAAGNRSQAVERRQIAVDRQIVYVDPAAGSTFGNGTREFPFSEIAVALDVVRNSERSTIALASGTYNLNGLPITAPENAPIVVVGGYNSSDWSASSEPTRFTDEIRIAGAVTLQSVELNGSLRVEPLGHGAVTVFRRARATTAEIAAGSHVLVEQGAFGTVSSQDAILDVKGAEIGALRISGGSVRVENAMLGDVHSAVGIGAAEPAGLPLGAELSGAVLTARAANLVVRDTLVAGINRLSVIQLTDTATQISGSRILAQAQDSTLALRAFGGSGVVNGSVFLVREARYGYAVSTRNARFGFYNGMIEVRNALGSREAVVLAGAGSGAAEIAHSVIVIETDGGLRDAFVPSTALTLANNALVARGGGTLVAPTADGVPIHAVGNAFDGWTVLLRHGSDDARQRRDVRTIREVEEFNTFLGVVDAGSRIEEVGTVLPARLPDISAAAADLIHGVAGGVRWTAPALTAPLFPGAADTDVLGARRGTRTVTIGPIETR